MKTALIIPYFGPLPPWWALFELSIKHNPDYTFLLITDQPVDQPPANLKVFADTLDNYCQKISRLLNIDFRPKSPYKLCDARPVLGKLHENLLHGFDFYGHCDIDLIFGNINDFMPNNPMQYNAISTHRRRTAGHFSLFRNQEKNRNAYRHIKHFGQLLMDDQHHGIDENHFSRIYYRHKSKPEWLRRVLFKFSWYTRSNYFKEQYSTPYTHNGWIDGSFDFPTQWYWKDGRITSNRDGDREFMYLHFMALKTERLSLIDGPAPWETIDTLVNVSATDAEDGFRINLQGFFALDAVADADRDNAAALPTQQAAG